MLILPFQDEEEVTKAETEDKTINAKHIIEYCITFHYPTIFD